MKTAKPSKQPSTLTLETEHPFYSKSRGSGSGAPPSCPALLPPLLPAPPKAEFPGFEAPSVFLLPTATTKASASTAAASIAATARRKRADGKPSELLLTAGASRTLAQRRLPAQPSALVWRWLSSGERGRRPPSVPCSSPAPSTSRPKGTWRALNRTAVAPLFVSAPFERSLLPCWRCRRRALSHVSTRTLCQDDT